MNSPAQIPWQWEHSYAELPSPCFSEAPPSPVPQPVPAVFNAAWAEELGLGELNDLPPETLAEIFSGNQLPPGAKPIAMAYAGHQFGHFNVLGDGRAILLGEHIDPKGHRHDIQLKGAGRTRYSRGGDGRGALGPMLREYLISEAIAALGIPTTRSLAVVQTGESVLRQGPRPGAVLVRTAASHLRVGTFALFAALEDRQSLQALLDYTITRHYPALADADNPALALLEAVMRNQADLVASWMAVGFVHGVLNTDNVALSGETIDYGPCAFVDRFHQDAVYSSIDSGGRYAYRNQPSITAWNLAQFAASLLPLINSQPEEAIARAETVLGDFQAIYERAWLQRMGAKFGLADPIQNDAALIDDWLVLLEKHRLDFTNAYRALSGDSVLEQSVLDRPDFLEWRQRLESRLAATGASPADIQALRDRHNPCQIPRNHAVQSALDQAEAGDLSAFNEALRVLKNPYSPDPECDLYAKTPSEDEQCFTSFCGT